MDIHDRLIRARIDSLSGDSSDYWSFKKRAKRDYCHGLMTYPAMMVPEMQGELIEILLEVSPEITSIYDPFVGSGTVLGEALLRGLNFIGTDVNPLAILCCEAKADFFSAFDALSTVDSIESQLHSIFDYNIIEFKGSTKWFEPKALAALSKLHCLIVKENKLWIRRFLWIVLSETVRKFSNTRASTYKLHKKASILDVDSSLIYSHFFTKARKNIALKNKLWDELDRKGLLEHGRPKNSIDLDICDIRQLPANIKADLVVTSPPYGDNATTVTYGQYSYLPLNFIDLNDVRSNFDRSIIKAQSAIDSASLGGNLRDIGPKTQELRKQSVYFSRTVSELENLGLGGEKRFVSFTYDLMLSLKKISESLNQKGYVMLTLGNRRINKLEIPLHLIVQELLECSGLSKVTQFDREIPTKRMPGTMRSEYILIMRKN